MFNITTIWILIPLAGIAVGAFKHWLEFQRETRNSTSELDNVVGELTRALQESRQRERELVERLENLETLVTSRLWRAVQDDPIPTTPHPRTVEPQAGMPPPPPDPAREAELARGRMRMRPDPGQPSPYEPDAREKARRMAERLGVGG